MLVSLPAALWTTTIPSCTELGPVVAAGGKDANGDVPMGGIDGVDVEPPAGADQETKELFLDLGAQAAKRRMVDLESPEAAAKVAADLQAAAARAAATAGGSSGL